MNNFQLLIARIVLIWIICAMLSSAALKQKDSDWTAPLVTSALLSAAAGIAYLWHITSFSSVVR